jgi:hypothetical protein
MVNKASAFAAALAPLRQTEWVVYAKKPFAGPVCFSNHPLSDITRGFIKAMLCNRRRPQCWARCGQP